MRSSPAHRKGHREHRARNSSLHSAICDQQIKQQDMCVWGSYQPLALNHFCHWRWCLCEDENKEARRPPPAEAGGRYGARAMNGKTTSSKTDEMTRQKIMASIVECAERLGEPPSQNQLVRRGDCTKRQIQKHFGSYAAALRECNLKARGSGWKFRWIPCFATGPWWCGP
jgi:hypothetical protein